MLVEISYARKTPVGAIKIIVKRQSVASMVITATQPEDGLLIQADLPVN